MHRALDAYSDAWVPRVVQADYASFSSGLLPSVHSSLKMVDSDGQSSIDQQLAHTQKCTILTGIDNVTGVVSNPEDSKDIVVKCNHRNYNEMDIKMCNYLHK